MFAVIHRNRLILSSLFAAVVLIAVIVGVYSLDNKTNTTVVNYIQSYGWEITREPVEISHLTIPTDFDPVYTAYNELLGESGFDLSLYKGKKVSRYTYRVLNHTTEHRTPYAPQTVLANVMVCENSIIGADISSDGVNGFIHTINDIEQIIK